MSDQDLSESIQIKNLTQQNLWLTKQLSQITDWVKHEHILSICEGPCGLPTSERVMKTHCYNDDCKKFMCEKCFRDSDIKSFPCSNNESCQSFICNICSKPGDKCEDCMDLESSEESGQTIDSSNSDLESKETLESEDWVEIP